MTEYYNLPVQFSEEERQQYVAWALKKEKTLKPFFTIVVLVDLSILIGTLLYFVGALDALPFLGGVMQTTGDLIPSLVNILFGVTLFLIIKPLDMLCDKLFKRPQESRMLRLEPRVSGMQYQLMQGKKLLCHGVLSWDEWNSAIIPQTNQIWIENECLTIGANTLKTIYPENKQHLWMDRPAEKIVGSINLKEIQRKMVGYRASLEEQKREAEWLRQNQHNLQT